MAAARKEGIVKGVQEFKEARPPKLQEKAASLT
jgi:hypothetical protein